MLFDPASAIAIYSVVNPMPIAAAIPDARQLPDGRVIVRTTLSNLQKLRRLELPVIPPMDYYYDWPIKKGRVPGRHQRVQANFMALNPHCFNLSDMGTQKTLSALWAAEYIMLHYPPGQCRALIVTTKSTMRIVWADEIFNNFLGRRTAGVVYGDADRRLKVLGTPHDFYIVNHDGLKIGGKSRKKDGEWSKIAQQLRDRPDIRIVIVDEGSAFKDATTDRSKIARQIIVPKDYVWWMSGTPTPNGPLDAYGAAKLVNGSYGESFKSYRERTMNQVSNFKWIPRIGAKQIVAEMLSPAVRFSIEECADLPECVTSQREAELSAEQRGYLKTLRAEASLQMANGAQITAANEAVLRSKLIQISCGAVYDATHKAHFIDCSDRIAVLKETIEQATRKVIVFAPFTSVLEMLKVSLVKNFSVELINGSVSDKKRADIFRAFQQDEHPRVLLADPGTMAHGLTLVAATTIVWFAPTDKTELYLQANKRIDRPGQVHTTSIVQIASTPAEREIYRRLASNESLQGAIMKLMEGRE